MNEAKSQPGYQLYASAIVKLDPKQLIERVVATEAKSDNSWKTHNAPQRFYALSLSDAAL